jgi:hypothetical protein
MPNALARARKDYLAATSKSAEHFFSEDLLQVPRDATRGRTVSGALGARPTIKFVDVGGRWVDEKDQVRRAKASMHRALVRSQGRAMRGVRIAGVGAREAKRRRVAMARTLKRKISRVMLRKRSEGHAKVAEAREREEGSVAILEELEKAREKHAAVVAQLEALKGKSKASH